MAKTNISTGRKPAHGFAGTPTYYSWQTMKRRCYDPRCHNYLRYGGRGITYCNRWERFENFIADMGERPEGTTIHRLDPEGNYEPGNCIWASAKQQARERRDEFHHRITVDGETLCISEWAERLGMVPSAINMRLARGWTERDAVTQPPNATRPRYLTLNGETRSMKEWSEQTGIPRRLISQRLSRGWSIDRALTAKRQMT